MAKVIIKLYFERFERPFENQLKTYLHAMGHLMVNQMGEMAHKDTGTLANSMTYKLDSGAGSQFSTKWGAGRPPSGSEVSKPGGKNSVRAGSALVYAGPQERHNAWASKSLDLLRMGSFETLAKRVFRI
ncbi:MAG: hypothetical protein JSW06_02755 [Thermoplasmatales archaeon]|nr:MAG: hypothetical protein JSW06_02755 [Thermoplasmatales archaeon]